MTTQVQRIDKQPNQINKELSKSVSCVNNSHTPDTVTMPTSIHKSKLRKFDSTTVLSLDSFVKKLDLIINTSKEARQNSFCLYQKKLSDKIQKTLPFLDLIKYSLHNLPDNEHIINIIKDESDNPTS